MKSSSLGFKNFKRMIVRDIYFNFDSSNLSDEEIKNYHIEYGRMSNIPDCCIDYFCEFWSPYCDTEKINEEEFKKRYDMDFIDYILNRENSAGYVRCPNCMKHNKKNRLIYNYEIVEEVIKLAKKFNLKYYFTKTCTEYKKSFILNMVTECGHKN